MKNKKGSVFDALPGYVIVIGMIAVIMSVMATVLTQVRSTQTANALDYNLTTQGLTSLTTLGGWQSF